jgi:hypothetical protein
VKQLTFRDSFVFKGKPVCKDCLKKLESLPVDSIPSQFRVQKQESLGINGERESLRVAGTKLEGRAKTMIITGTVLIVIALVALVARDSIVSSMKEKANETLMLKSWSEGQRMTKEAELIGNIIQYGGYGIGALGIILLTVGLIGYVQQTSTSKIAQIHIGTQAPQKATTSGESIPEQIEQLAKLKTQGILSEAEFEEKKKDLLSRL